MYSHTLHKSDQTKHNSATVESKSHNAVWLLLKIFWEDATSFMKPVFVYNRTVTTVQLQLIKSHFN